MPESYWLANRQPADAEFQRLELLGSLYGRTVKEQLRTLGFGAGATVLEIGPGSGHFVRWLIDEGAHVTVNDGRKLTLLRRSNIDPGWSRSVVGGGSPS